VKSSGATPKFLEAGASTGSARAEYINMYGKHPFALSLSKGVFWVLQQASYHKNN
jgi:hypothetical protein